MGKLSRFGVPENYLTVSQFAEKANVTVPTVRNWMDDQLIDWTRSAKGKIVNGHFGTKVIHERELEKL